MQTAKPTLVNAEGLIVGRMCSKVAKRLLNGEESLFLTQKKPFSQEKRKAKS